jgi:putative phosphoesterase
MKIGLLSDTHGYWDPRYVEHFKDCDEIWHAGDIGSTEVIDRLAEFKPVRAVYGNIDGQEIRVQYPQFALFMAENVKVLLTHIGGYPGRYAPGIREKLYVSRPRLFIAGHSHILKVQFDPSLNCLYMNPGAAGISGFHQVRTLIRFAIEGENIRDLEVIELGKR